jgi:hypothetical protein
VAVTGTGAGASAGFLRGNPIHPGRRFDMKRLFAVVTSVGLAVLLVSGCSSNKLRPPKNLGEDKVVEKTPKNKPGWVGTSYKEKEDFIYFSGEVTDVADRSLGMRQAKADAVQNLVESIKVKARSDFSEAVKGVNTPQGRLGRYVDSLVVWTTENLDVSGAIPVEEYTEKVRTQKYDGYGYTYNCYVWLRLAKDEYFLARQGALDRADREAEDDEARQLAEEAKEKLEQL